MGSKFFPCLLSPHRVKLKGVQPAGLPDNPGDGVRERAASSPGFDHHRPRPHLQHLTDHGDVGMVQDLGSVREDPGPKFWSWPEDVDDLAGFGGPLHAPLPPNDVIMVESAVLVVEDKILPNRHITQICDRLHSKRRIHSCLYS